MKWYLQCLKKYATFNGRARRSEFWFFHLVQFCVYFFFLFSSIILSYLVSAISWGDIIAGLWGLLYLFYIVITFLPAWAVFVRRLHDVGMSGWWLPVIPAVSTGSIIVMADTKNDDIAGLIFLAIFALSTFIGIYLFIRLVSDSDVDTNRYGVNPKEDDNISAVFK